jgi:hypothetical protein
LTALIAVRPASSALPPLVVQVLLQHISIPHRKISCSEKYVGRHRRP